MISVLVVDDSVVVRRLVTDVLNADSRVQVLATAPNGEVALAKLARLTPDVVTLDVEMPVLDGLATLRALRRTHPRLPVIMFSTLTSAGAAATLDALAAGATDYVTKPAHTGSMAEAMAAVREQLLPRVHALGARPRRVRPVAPTTPPAPRRTGRVDVIALGSSTGGPDALTRVLGALPATLPVPVVAVQHMPPVFTRMFAERLDRAAAVHVVEADSGMPLRPGTVYLAPGDRHLEVIRRGGEVVTRLHDGAPENFCRPAVDVLFRSVAGVYGAGTVAVVLTGMGQDGREGARVLRTAGAEIVAQDEATSVVWGMPGAVVGAGLADAVLPLEAVAGHLMSRLTAGVRGTTP